jgi:hypothetical protein
MIDSGQRLDRIEIGLRRLLPNRGVSGSKLNCLFLLFAGQRDFALAAKVLPGRLMAIIVTGRTAARIEKNVFKFQRKVSRPNCPRSTKHRRRVVNLLLPEANLINCQHRALANLCALAPLRETIGLLLRTYSAKAVGWRRRSRGSSRNKARCRRAARWARPGIGRRRRPRSRRIHWSLGRRR